jgi:hypothetical protein
MNQGSGEWWVYGEDGNFFYYFLGKAKNFQSLKQQNAVLLTL